MTLLIAALGAFSIVAFVASAIWFRRALAFVIPLMFAVLFWGAVNDIDYLDLDYSQAGQRDWHAPVFGALGLMLAQGWPGRAGWWGSALALATALAIRPQVALFAPALALAVAEGARRPIAAVAGWGAAVGVLTALWFVPLVAAGVLGDFFRGLRLVSVGTYNQTGPARFVAALLGQFLNLEVLVVVASDPVQCTRTGLAPAMD